ncbi:MAG: HlyD family efflux transporter periplasmic adaptor subunit [Methylotenera sp.]
MSDSANSLQDEGANSANKLEVISHLNARAMQALKPADLQYIIVNETFQLYPYRQAVFFTISTNQPYKLAAASGLVTVAEDSPFVVWLNQMAKNFPKVAGNFLANFSQADAKYRDGWEEWLPENLLLIPLVAQDDKVLGLAMYAREEAWAEIELEKISAVHQSYAYCLSSLLRTKNSFIKRALGIFNAKRFTIAAIILGALLFIPVRLSALAPAEVVALNAFSIAAPQEGVIHAFKVKPNALVKKGDILFILDDTSITNRYEVAAKALAIAKSDALVAEQRSFDDMKSKGELASSIGRVREKEAELASIKDLMSRVEVAADRDGIAIFTDENDWIGRPVQTGERIMQIADPKDAGLLMWLPVQDALNLELGAPMRLFLNTQPLQPISAKLVETSYQATTSPQNVSAYRIKGAFLDANNQPRIGLHGTARISGEWANLGYFLFRRPISALRAWTGL